MSTSTVSATPTARHGREPLISAYPLLIALLAVALGVSGAPAPLYGVYEREWHLAPITTTLVFAVYAAAALGSVLVSGQVSDRCGRKPLLVAAVVTMIVGLVIFMAAQGVAALFVARALHGAAVGATVVAGSAALLDLRPQDGARTGHLTGIMFNIGMAVLVLLLNLLMMGETHQARGVAPIRLSRPRVPREIRQDFRFAVLGVM